LIAAATHTKHTHTHNHLTALYPGQPRWAGTTTLKNVKTIYHCPQFLTGTLDLPSQTFH